MVPVASFWSRDDALFESDIPKGLHELRAVAIEYSKFKSMVHSLQVKDVTLTLLLHFCNAGPGSRGSSDAAGVADRLA